MSRYIRVLYELTENVPEVFKLTFNDQHYILHGDRRMGELQVPVPEGVDVRNHVTKFMRKIKIFEFVLFDDVEFPEELVVMMGHNEAPLMR